MKYIYEFEIKRHRRLIAREDTATWAEKFLAGPEQVAELVRVLIGEHEYREKLFVFLVNTKHRILGVHLAAVGADDHLIIEPKEVFRAAILAGATAIVIAHNHPSGDPKPSDSDREVTRRVTAAGSLLGISLIDHVIVGEKSHHSMSGM